MDHILVYFMEVMRVKLVQLNLDGPYTGIFYGNDACEAGLVKSGWTIYWYISWK